MSPVPFLALQTDSRGVTAVVVDGTPGGGVLGVASVDLPADAGKLVAALKSSLGKSLAGRLEVGIALGADTARVRRLVVPPVPAEELPAIVAMQAARDAAVDVEGLVVDFLPPGESPAEQGTLLVASTEASVLDFWRAVAEGLGGKLSIAAPRPLATIALAADLDAPIVVVATDAGEAIDFVVRVGGVPHLLRSARSDQAGASRELRRTLLALNEVAGDEQPMVVSGADGLGNAATPLDWKAVAESLGGAATQLRAAGAACGLALAHQRGDISALNLVDPRKPPVAETGRRRQVLLAAATATVLAAGAWMAYERVASLDRQIQEKQAEIAEARKSVKAFDPYRERVATLDDWRQSDVTWLDEFERLGRKLRPESLDSEGFPAENDLRVTQLVATALVGGDEPGGRIDLVAQARSTSTSELESRLRDSLHPVRPISTSETPAQDAYRYKYNVLLRAPAEVQEVELQETDADEPQAAEDPEPVGEEAEAVDKPSADAAEGSL